jgi:hypothetical protein
MLFKNLLGQPVVNDIDIREGPTMQLVTKSLAFLALLVLTVFCRQTQAARVKFTGLELPYEFQIQALVDSVNIDSVMGYIRDQQEFYTRFSLTDSSFSAADWMAQKYSDWGYIAAKDSFWMAMPVYCVPDSGYEFNVIGRKNGSIMPQNILILSGHRDAASTTSFTDPYAAAPGADDDASGVAAAMEAARLFKDRTWDKTFEFIGFAAEETGFGYGALHYAGLADSLEWNIDAMIDGDMIGYEVTGGLDLEWFRDDTLGGYSLAETYKELGSKYIPALLISSGWTWFSDTCGAPNAYAFMSYKYPALQVVECGCTMNPYYHTANDTAGVLNPIFLEKAVRLMVAGMAVVNLYPSPIESLSITNPGDGERLIVSWDVLPEPDVSYYRIYYGITPGVFDSLTVYGLCDTLEGLQSESTYHLTVRGFDAEGHPSWFAWDFTGTTTLGVSASRESTSINQGKFKFQAVTPNPVGHVARILYQAPSEGQLRLDVCNINGQVVKTLFKGWTTEGDHQLIWRSDNNLGEKVSNGIYFLKAGFEDGVFVQKMTILR